MNSQFLKYNQYIQNDCYGKFVIIKVSNHETLKSMKQGNLWFRHPAYFNYAENKNGDSDMGDKYDNKLEYLSNDHQFLPENTIRITGLLSGKNLDCIATIRFIQYSDGQDEKRQISFYKLRIDEKGFYETVDNRMGTFGDSFVLVNIDGIIEYLSRQKYTVCMGECAYYDEETYNGECDTFFKRCKYKYQNEFRINISHDEFKKQINDSVQIQEKNQLNSHYIDKIINNELSKDERFSADNDSKKLEIEIEKLKSEFYESINVGDDFLSNIMPIKSLLLNSSIEQW